MFRRAFSLGSDVNYGVSNMAERVVLSPVLCYVSSRNRLQILEGTQLLAIHVEFSLAFHLTLAWRDRHAFS